MGPKKPTEPGESKGVTEKFAELEDYIKDYILEDKSDDPFLNSYISLVRLEERTETSLFEGGLLDRPIFWERHIRPWILEGFQELQIISI